MAYVIELSFLFTPSIQGKLTDAEEFMGLVGGCRNVMMILPPTYDPPILAQALNQLCYEAS